jgi:hypothetical protein
MEESKTCICIHSCWQVAGIALNPQYSGGHRNWLQIRNIYSIYHTLITYIHTYTHHSRFIPEGITEVSQIFLGDINLLPKLGAMKNTADLTGGKPIAVLLQSISGVSAY